MSISNCMVVIRLLNPSMKLYIDGSCNMNIPIEDRIIKAVVTDENGIVLIEKQVKGKSSNIAEFWAIAEALAFARNCGLAQVDLLTDSRNNLSWFKGRIGKKLNDRATVINLHEFINRLRMKLSCTITWIPREKNLAG